MVFRKSLQLLDFYIKVDLLLHNASIHLCKRSGIQLLYENVWVVVVCALCIAVCSSSIRNWSECTSSCGCSAQLQTWIYCDIGVCSRTEFHAGCKSFETADRQ